MVDYINSVSVYSNEHWEGLIFVDVTTFAGNDIASSCNFKLSPESALEFAKKLVDAQADIRAREIIAENNLTGEN